MENTILQNQVKRIAENVNTISNNEIEFLCELFQNERIKRGLLEKPEIEAARHLYQACLDNEWSHKRALNRTIKAAKFYGHDLTENDITGKVSNNV